MREGCFGRERIGKRCSWTEDRKAVGTVGGKGYRSCFEKVVWIQGIKERKGKAWHKSLYRR